MGRLPDIEIQKKIVHSPHVVILGAGASKAACPRGDAGGRNVPVMADLIDCLQLKDILESQGFPNATDFEAVYDALVSSGRNPSLVQEIENRVLKYFDDLSLPEEVTTYDYLVTSLRENDIIATFNWDPFLMQAYTRNRFIKRLPRLAFLHGNVQVGVCIKDRVKGWFGDECEKCSELLGRSKLLYPVSQKRYTEDPYIANEWKELERALGRGYLLTIFGYAAPSNDAGAVDLMRHFWGDNPTWELAQVNIVDIAPRRVLRKRWAQFFCDDHYEIYSTIRRTWLFGYPRRSCEALAMATLQCDPWHDNPFPEVQSLEALHSWLEPLLREEEEGAFTGNPCSDSGM